MKAISDDEYKLSTGRTFYAHNYIIGLDPDGRVSEGYDGSVNFDRYDYGSNTFVDDWTLDEKLELASFMVDLWIRQWVKWVVENKKGHRFSETLLTTTRFSRLLGRYYLLKIRKWMMRVK